MNKIVYLTGLLMAMADSVPGVSGGTIAFILGVYDDLISNIYNLKDKAKRSASIKFLTKLGIGWIIGFVSAIFLISGLVESHAYIISSTFLGFIVASIPLTIKEEQESLKGHYQYLIFTIIGILIVTLISYFGQAITAGTSGLTAGFATYIYVFLVGSLAICSMLLPGISGSTILVIFGIYFSIISYIKEVLTFNFEHIGFLIALASGILFGAFAFINLINYLFTHYRAQTIYTIEGLMIGSLYPIILGPTTIETHSYHALTFDTFSIFGFIIGVLIISSLTIIKTKMEKADQTEQTQ